MQASTGLLKLLNHHCGGFVHQSNGCENEILFPIFGSSILGLNEGPWPYTLKVVTNVKRWILTEVRCEDFRMELILDQSYLWRYKINFFILHSKLS
jgi:hypothetical protein